MSKVTKRDIRNWIYWPERKMQARLNGIIYPKQNISWQPAAGTSSFSQRELMLVSQGNGQA